MESVDVLPGDLPTLGQHFDLAPQSYMTVRSTKKNTKSVNFRTMTAESAGGNSEKGFATGFKSMGKNMRPTTIARRVGSFLNHRKPKTDNLSEGARQTVQYFEQALGKSEHSMVIRTQEEIQAEKNKETALPRFVLHPYNPGRISWDLVSMALLLYSIVTVPVKIAFNFSAEDCSTRFLEQRWHWYTDLLVDFAFMIDVCINLRTAFFHKSIKGRLVSDSKSIFLNYLKGFLLFDLVSCVPMDLILLPYACDEEAGGSTSVNTIARAPAIVKRLRMLRVVRLLRVTRIRRLLERIRDTLHINPGVLRLIKFSFFVSLVAHYDACIFFWIGEQEKARTPFQSWTTNVERFFDAGAREAVRVEELELSNQYTVSLYWAATTLTTVGFGDITPVTTWEFGFCMFVIIQGGVALGYVVGSMADLLSRLNMRKKRHLEKVEYWESAFHRGGFPAPLRRKIRSHNEYVFRNRISKLPAFAEEELSRSLLRDITAHIYKEALGSLPMFRGLSDEVITELALALDHVQLPPGETLYREGDWGDSMYFLQRGDVQLSMLLMSNKHKQSLRERDLAEFIERVGETVSQHEIVQTGSIKHHAEPAECAAITTYKKNSNITKYQVRVGAVSCSAFKWGINQTTCSFFGESVLFSGDEHRLSSAVTVTGCTLLVLTAKSMKFVCEKYPAMNEVAERMKPRRRRPKIQEVGDRIVHSLRSRGDVQCRLHVSIHDAVNMPKMDNFGGRCDAYAIVDVGPAREGKLRYETLRIYNTYSPTWNETFKFPVKDVYTPGSVVVNFELWDWDLVGDHDFIGMCHVDLSEAARRAWETGEEEVQEPRWVSIMSESNGKLRTVKGHNRKHSKIRLSFRMVPPPGGKEAADVRRSCAPSLSGGTVPMPLRASSVPDITAPDPEFQEAKEGLTRQRSSSVAVMPSLQVHPSVTLQTHPSVGDSTALEQLAGGLEAAAADGGAGRASYKAQSARRMLPEVGPRYAMLEGSAANSAANSATNSAGNSPRGANQVSAPPSIPDLDAQTCTVADAVSRSPSVRSIPDVGAVAESESGVWQRHSATGDTAAAVELSTRAALLPDDDPGNAVDSLEQLKARAQQEVEQLEEADEWSDAVELRKTVRMLRESAKLGWGTVQQLVSRFEKEEQRASEDQTQLLQVMRMLQSLAVKSGKRTDGPGDMITREPS